MTKRGRSGITYDRKKNWFVKDFIPDDVRRRDYSVHFSASPGLSELQAGRLRPQARLNSYHPTRPRWAKLTRVSLDTLDGVLSSIRTEWHYTTFRWGSKAQTPKPSQHPPNRVAAVRLEYLLEIGRDAVARHAAVAHHEVIRLLFGNLGDDRFVDVVIKTGSIKR